jgi:Mg-chelatase subunit ChlD
MTSLSQLCCPITYESFVDPVKMPDGHTYEREAITTALAINGLSPITRQPMCIDDAVTDYTILTLVAQKNSSGEEKLDPTEEKLDPAETPEKNKNITGKIQKNENLTLITLQTEDDGENSGQSVVFVIDISGSMNTEISNGAERDGFNVLDIVKHAGLVCLESLRPSDSAAIIAYSSTATLNLPMTRMSNAGKNIAKAALKSLEPQGSTNIWSGLKMALDQLGDGGTIMLLTDGCPNIRPPRGEHTMLQKELDNHTDVVINTFGFGYNLDSELLRTLSNETFGSYSFIPTVGEVGTVFVHAMADLRTCLRKPTKIAIETEGTIQMPNLEKTSWGYFLHQGQLQKGYPRKIEIECTSDCAFSILDVDLEVISESFDSIQSQKMAAIIMKCHYLSEFSEGRAVEYLETMINKFEWKKSYLADLNGQVRKAIESTNFKKWGKHYLPSLAGAYQYQRCNNFLDIGIQQFCGETFEKVRTKLDEVFNTLPPPKPTHRERMVNDCIRMGRAASVPLRDLSSYNDRSGPCFAGHCRVTMADGSQKRCENVNKGDIVVTSNDGHSEVVCVVETKVDGISMIQYSKLCISKWHPIKKNGIWIFPNNLKKKEIIQYAGKIYSFLLLNKQGKYAEDLIIENEVCIALAHGIENDSVATHPFYGSMAVVNELKKAPENDGKVCVKMVKRDKDTGLVCGFFFAEESNIISNRQIIKMIGEEKIDEAVKLMFTRPSDGGRMDYAEMRSHYG